MEKQLKDAVQSAQSFEEVEILLKDHPELDPKQVWDEVEKHRSNQSEKLDLDELEAVSGGADRDWIKDGCAATSEPDSWCWSNDQCLIWDVTYDNFWVCCPDGHEHVFKTMPVRAATILRPLRLEIVPSNLELKALIRSIFPGIFHVESVTSKLSKSLHC